MWINPRTECVAVLGATSKATVCDGGITKAILAPLSYVALHVVQAPTVGQLLSHRVGLEFPNPPEPSVIGKHWHGTVVGCEDVIEVGSLRGVRQCGNRRRPGRAGPCPLNAPMYREGPSLLRRPDLLEQLLAAGRWPRTVEEQQRQNLSPSVPAGRVQRLAPEESELFLLAPPFRTVREKVGKRPTNVTPP
jgi:hypothetical protein